MSRGFVKEDDREEAPFIPPRAALPKGMLNYVTPEGMKQLKMEQDELENARVNVERENDAEKRRQLALINGKLALLNERINSAKVMEAKKEQTDQVRFGTTVSYKILKGRGAGKTHTFKIVGVDEANIQKKKVAFTAPVIRAMMGKRVGEKVQFSLGNEQQQIEIFSVQ